MSRKILKCFCSEGHYVGTWDEKCRKVQLDECKESGTWKPSSADRWKLALCVGGIPVQGFTENKILRKKILYVFFQHAAADKPVSHCSIVKLLC